MIGGRELTRDEHEDSVGHDKHLHRGHSPARGKHTAVGDQVMDNLGVEQCAEPSHRACVEDERSLEQPGILLGRLQAEDTLALDHGKGHSEGGSNEDNEQRQEADCVFCLVRKERDHGPSLIHERPLGNNSEKHGEDSSGDAGAVVPRGDLGVVAAPDLVKVRKGREEVECEKHGADGADDEGEDVQETRGAEELCRRGGEEDDEDHGEGGAELGAVVDEDAGGFVVEGVDLGDGDEDGGEVGGADDGDVLGVWVEGHFCGFLFSFLIE